MRAIWKPHDIQMCKIGKIMIFLFHISECVVFLKLHWGRYRRDFARIRVRMRVRVEGNYCACCCCCPRSLFPSFLPPSRGRPLRDEPLKLLLAERDAAAAAALASSSRRRLCARVRITLEIRILKLDNILEQRGKKTETTTKNSLQ